MSLPPGPREPALLQSLRWILRPVEFLEQCNARYGPMFTMKLMGSKEIVHINHPDGLRALFGASEEIIEAGSGRQHFKPLLGAKSMLLVDGLQHRRIRKMMMPLFQGPRMRAYGGVIRDVTLRVTDEWSVGQEINLYESIKAIAFEVAMQAVFGLKVDGTSDEAAPIRDVLKNPAKILAFIPVLQHDLGPGSPGRYFLRTRGRCDQLIYEQIRLRRANPDPDRQDVLSKMIAMRDENGEPLSDEELRDQLITVALAGFESTAITVSWLIQLLHTETRVLDKLRAELEGVDAEGPSEAITSLPYLKATCEEALRIWPAVPWAFRLAVKPFTVMGRELPAGTRMVAGIYLTHRRPEIYPEPQVFRPERFLDHQFTPFEYLPFGGGRRRCLGAPFSLFEMRIVLTLLLSRFRFALKYPRTKPVRFNVLIGPRGGAPVTILERR